MHYKSCTLEDVIFYISSKLPNRPCVTDDNFDDVSIITAKNIHKDEVQNKRKNFKKITSKSKTLNF